MPDNNGAQNVGWTQLGIRAKNANPFAEIDWEHPPLWMHRKPAF